MLLSYLLLFKCNEVPKFSLWFLSCPLSLLPYDFKKGFYTGSFNYYTIYFLKNNYTKYKEILILDNHLLLLWMLDNKVYKMTYMFLQKGSSKNQLILKNVSTWRGNLEKACFGIYISQWHCCGNLVDD